jgi:C-terminal processing protease CtpA/Prc
VIVDEPHRRMILEPNAHFSTPSRYNALGATIRAEGPDLRTYRVFWIAESSPAARAGLRKGDLLLSIDGRPAAEYSLDDLYGLFKEAGRTIVLRYERAGRPVERSVTLRELL